ncbi:DUF4838 domain-containing protein [Candidatus Woesearchaeota archaeon]|nr:DUF4838 domain-containing protein [Candidatus Woesearchaeota archaeon]
MNSAALIMAMLMALLLLAGCDDNIAGQATHSRFHEFSEAYDVSVQGQALTVRDDAIYKTGWYASDGDNQWMSFTLNGNSYADSDDWLVGEATYTLPIFGSGEHYVIIYSCTNNNGWDCHDKWQLRVINNEEEGLISHWAFDQDARDEEERNDGQLMNGAAIATDPQRGSVLILDGEDDFVRVPDSSSLDVTSQITLSAWIRLDSYGSSEKIIIKPTTGGADPWELYALDLRDEGIRFIISDGTPNDAGGWHAVPSSNKLPLHEWHQVVSTYDGATMSIYIDGILSGTKTVTLTIATSDEDLRIGNFITGRNTIDGMIDDVMIYGYALSQSEVKDLYDSQKTTAPTNRYLVEEGVGQAQIIISPDSPPAVQLAADELQEGIEKMSGATLPINTVVDEQVPYKIYVGQSTYTDGLGITSDGLSGDGFKMVSGEDHLILLGDDTPFHLEGIVPYDPSYEEWDALTGTTWGNPLAGYGQFYNPDYDLWQGDHKGSLNAVYEFLYDQGIRWYYPGSIGEIIPEKPTITLSQVDETVIPDFSMRNLYHSYARYAHSSGEERQKMVKWQLRMRMNYYEDELGTIWSHGIQSVISRDEMKAAHPEYYAVYDGVRMNGSSYKHNLCSEGLFQEHLDFVRFMLDTYPEMSAIGVSPVDAFHRVSEEEPICRPTINGSKGHDGYLSDHVFEYVNNVAWELYDEYPDRKLLIHAYYNYVWPPEGLSKPLAPNLAVFITRWRGPYRYLDNQFYLPNSLFPYEDNLEYYQAITDKWVELLPSKELYIREYYLFNAAYMPTERAPAVFPHLIAEDLQFQKGKTKGQYIEVFYLSDVMKERRDVDWDVFAANALNVWVSSRLYWDADQDVDLLLEEYYDLFYGPASEEMRAFYEYAEANWREATAGSETLQTLIQMANDARVIAGDTIYGERIDLLLGLMGAG